MALTEARADILLDIKQRRGERRATYKAYAKRLLVDCGRRGIGCRRLPEPAPATEDRGSQHEGLTGTKKADVIAGQACNDKIKAKNGNDTVCGGAGKDLLAGGRGASVLRGERHADDIRGNGDPDRIHGGAGKDACHGGLGKNRLRRCE